MLSLSKLLAYFFWRFHLLYPKQAVNTHGQDGMCDVKGIRVNTLPAINEKVLPGAA